jgi:hypothetical protein
MRSPLPTKKEKRKKGKKKKEERKEGKGRKEERKKKKERKKERKKTVFETEIFLKTCMLVETP